MPGPSTRSAWLHRYAVLTALATLVLLGVGGIVTSHGVGMAVPDWPTTYGYNMFFFPISYWVGGVFYEHSHRLVASVVGVLVVGLTRWLVGKASRRPLALIGALEVAAGLALIQLGPAWKGAGHFLAGIGGVVLLGAVIWTRNEPARKPLPWLGWLAFFGVQIQGLLGGLRVVLYSNETGVVHATLAQLFFGLVCVIVLLTSRWWEAGVDSGEWRAAHLPFARSRALRWAVLLTTSVILGQLILGAMMRHQHAGLAIPDFPLAYGKLWPAMDAAAVAGYNQQRLEITALNPITAFQIGLQMAHRIVAVVILLATGVFAWLARRGLGAKHPVSRLALAWLGLVLLQAILGAATIWSNKAADLATAHVLFGALSLALGGIVSIVCFRACWFVPETPEPSAARPLGAPAFGARPSGATGTP